MRRLLIFGLVGPTTGFLLALLTAAALGVELSDGTVLFVLLAYAFAAGVVPAVSTGCVDEYLASRTSPNRRLLLTPAAGYFLCVLIGFTLLGRRLSIEAIVIFALYGMIAATVCSALSSTTFSKSPD